MNFYNKLKAAIHEREGRPLYMISYYQFHGDINEQLLDEAYQEVQSRFNKEIIALNNDYNCAHEFSHKLALNVVTRQGDLKLASEEYIEHNYLSLIKDYKEPPFILTLIKNVSSDNDFVLVILINHIYGDGHSCKLYFSALADIYNRKSSKRDYEQISEVSFYNDAQFLKNVSDEKGITPLKIITLMPRLIVQLFHIMYSSSILNKVSRLNDGPINEDVIFKQIIIPTELLEAVNIKASTNSVITAVLCKSLLELKPGLRGRAVCYIPVDLRTETTSNCYGNFSGAIEINIKKSMPLASSIQYVQNQVAKNKDRLVLTVLYKLATLTSKKLSAELIYKRTLKAMTKFNFMCSNVNSIDKINGRKIALYSATLVHSGLFNYPCQGINTLAFVFNYNNNSIGVNISSDRNTLSIEEIKTLETIIKKNLHDIQ